MGEFPAATSFPIRVHQKHRGFTLIEIMVVMVIIGIVATTATLVISGNQERRALENEARKLIAVLQLVQDEAVFQNLEIGVRLEREGYHFRGLDEANLAWVELPQQYLRPREFPEWLELEFDGLDRGLEIRTLDPDQELDFFPQLLFFSSGESTPFQLSLKHKADRRVHYTLTSDGLNGIAFEEAVDA